MKNTRLIKVKSLIDGLYPRAFGESGGHVRLSIVVKINLDISNKYTCVYNKCRDGDINNIKVRTR